MDNNRMDFSEAMARLGENPDSINSQLMADMDTCNKNAQAFRKLETLISEGKEFNRDKAISSLAKSVRHMNEMNMKMLLLQMSYISGGNFQSDSFKASMKNGGDGQEILSRFFKAKFGHMGA